MLRVQLAVMLFLDEHVAYLRSGRWRRDDRGMTTETVIITAVLAALALAVTAIIVAKVTAKANSIDVGS